MKMISFQCQQRTCGCAKSPERAGGVSHPAGARLLRAGPLRRFCIMQVRRESHSRCRKGRMTARRRP